MKYFEFATMEDAEAAQNEIYLDEKAALYARTPIEEHPRLDAYYAITNCYACPKEYNGLFYIPSIPGYGYTETDIIILE